MGMTLAQRRDSPTRLILLSGLAFLAFPLLSCGGDGITKIDTTPPAEVADLAATAATSTTLLVTWTAPGDDGSEGTASTYDLRYSVAPITAANFAAATTVPSVPAPRSAGSAESFTIAGLSPRTTYYVALRTADEVPNVSGLSNVVARATSPGVGHVYHATPDGTGSDCGLLQACIDAAAFGDTIELGPGVYNTAADTLLSGSFGDPVVANMVARDGLVIRAGSGAEVRIDGQWQAGRVGILVPDDVEHLTIQGIRFDNCDPGIHATGGELVIRNCAFVSGGHGLVTSGTDLDLSDCRFEEYAGEAAVLRNTAGVLTRTTFMGNGSAIFAASSRNLTLDHVLVAFACFAGIRVEEGGTVTARSVTVLYAGMVPDDSTGIVVAGGASLTLDKSIVGLNRGYGVHCRTGGTLTITCTDFFDNSSGNYEGCPDRTGFDGNLAVNPLFCSTPDLDFHLSPGSPLRGGACGTPGIYGDEPCALRGSVGFPLAGWARAERRSR